MADQLKEIHTATIAVSDLTSEQYVDFFTTDASTQYNITAAVVGSNTFPVDPNLEVNNFKAATLSTTAIASAIVDVSSSVRLAFPSQLSFSKTVLALGTSNSTGWSVDTNFSINGTSVNTENNSLTGPNYYRGGLASTASDGDFFYFYTDGNSTTEFRKNAGGPTGTETVINSTTYRYIAFDGVRYYYWIQNTSTLRRYDIETETTTDISMSSTGMSNPSSYTRLMYCNGYLAYFNTSSGYPQIIDVSTGNRVRLSGTNYSDAYGYGGATIRVGFWIDPDTKNVAFISQSNSSTGPIDKVTLNNIGDFSTAYEDNNSAMGNSSTSYLDYSPTLSASYQISGMTGLDTFLGTTSSGVYEYTWDTATAIRQVNSESNYTEAYLSTEEAVSSPTDTDFPATIAVRLSGVQVTL